jgi:hypothetical protein
VVVVSCDDHRMTDIAAAAQFIAGHARLLERRRFALLEGDGSPERVLAALTAYQNADGGIGHLEPDLRTPASQPSCVLYALEVLHEAGIADVRLATDGLDWLRTVTTAEGGMPFVLATARGWPHAPWWVPEDNPPASLLMTAAITAMALRMGIRHPWVGPATEFCWAHAGEATDPYTLRYLVDFLDAVDDAGRAGTVLDAVAARIPADGVLRVDAGTDGETMRPLDLAPRPDHVGRRLFTDQVVERELDRLDAGQQPDGGWDFTWAAWNPAAAWEWRGIVTVTALRTLKAYGRLDPVTSGRG